VQGYALVYLYATAIAQVVHHASLELQEDHVRRGARKAFGNERRDRGIKQQLLLVGKRTLKEVLKQTLVLEVVKLAVGFSVRLQEISDRALWKSWPPLKRKKNYLRVNTDAVGAPATSRSSVPTDRKK
jgi:hypothetical protein